MKRTVKSLVFLLITIAVWSAHGQRLSAGITFQYLFLKQVNVDAPVIEGAHSYHQYIASDNRWKFFSAGQSIIIGTVLQADYKKFYGVVEPSFDLNTYNYSVFYPVGAQKEERLNFQSLFMQADVPLYIGYQFGTMNLVRYSVFAGGVLVMPYALEYSLQVKEGESEVEDYFNAADMEGVLYNYERQKYVNALAGFCLHFASLGKLDLRYQYRLGNPGERYPVSFHALGFALTYYLPLNLRKKRIYYEE